ncbi:hypothetical protein [Dyella agri]|uniref:TIGR03067 domain-containing protein n=1 Tax=Dyella agri TaxID=1926869 RepID=A0ABW8KK51_9GAMM
MRLISPFFIALSILSLGQAHACERNLLGTWKSDSKRSMEFIARNANLQPKTEAFLGVMLGHMTLTFTKDGLHSVMPSVDVTVNGQPRHLTGFEESKPYKVLFCNEFEIVWSAKRSFGKKDDVTTFQFVGPDTIWVYMGSTDPVMPDLNAREYFQRVQ